MGWCGAQELHPHLHLGAVAGSRVPLNDKWPGLASWFPSALRPGALQTLYPRNASVESCEETQSCHSVWVWVRRVREARLEG